MPLGTKILIVLSAALVLFISGFAFGYHYAQGQEAKKEIKVLETSITQATEQVAQDTKLTTAHAERKVKYITVYKTIEKQGLSDAALKATPQCDRDPESFRLLNSAIDASNSQGDSNSLSSGMPGTTQAQ